MDMLRALVQESDKKIKITFNGKASGQFRKDGSNEKLLDLLGDYKFTKFKDGVMKTYEWYLKNGVTNDK